MQVRRLREDELCHHGVKGQRWGIRRYQNPDGSLTEAGRRRYLNPDGSYNARYQKEIGSAQNKQKAQLTNKPIEKKSDEEIARRKKIAKTVAITAGVTLAAVGAAVAVKKIGDEYIDREFNDLSLNRVEFVNAKDDVKDMDRFFAAGNKHDINRYKGYLGYTRGNQSEQMGGKFGYKNVQLHAKKLKQASNKSARETFENLYKNDADFKADVDKMMSKTNQLDIVNGRVGRLKEKAKSGNMKKMYEYYNVNGLMGNTSSDTNKKFYNALKSRGYDAVQDINDHKYSGYNTKNPLIIFNNTNVSKIGESLQTDKNKAVNDYFKEDLKNKYLSSKSAAKAAALAGGLGAASYYSMSAEEKKRADRKGKNSNVKRKKTKKR